MALQIDNGVVSNNGDAWVTYRVLDDILGTVNELFMDGEVLDSVVVDLPEVNENLVDISSGFRYYIAIDKYEDIVFRIFEDDLRNENSSGLNWRVM